MEGAEAGEKPAAAAAAQKQVDQGLERAAANLAAREQQLRRDRDLAEAIAELAKDQQAAREAIAQAAEHLEQLAQANPLGPMPPAGEGQPMGEGKPMGDGQPMPSGPMPPASAAPHADARPSQGCGNARASDSAVRPSCNKRPVKELPKSRGKMKSLTNRFAKAWKQLRVSRLRPPSRPPKPLPPRTVSQCPARVSPANRCPEKGNRASPVSQCPVKANPVNRDSPVSPALPVSLANLADNLGSQVSLANRWRRPAVRTRHRFRS